MLAIKASRSMRLLREQLAAPTLEKFQYHLFLPNTDSDTKTCANTEYLSDSST